MSKGLSGEVKRDKYYSPADRANDVAIAFQAGKIKPEDLYDELRKAGLDDEEAGEMADLLEQPE